MTETVERRAWDRRPRESTTIHERFRVYRDLGPSRTVGRAAEILGMTEGTLQRTATRWDWRVRATAWDDECRMTEDVERLEAIRTMHRTHQRAGRAAFAVASRALAQIRPEELTAAEVVRLLDLGSRLERTGLAAEEERAGDVPGEDPWDQIARELAAGH